MYSRWRHPPKTVSPRPYCRSRRGRNGLGSETRFMLSIAINRAEPVCAAVIIKHNYVLMCNHNIVTNIMLCLLNSKYTYILVGKSRFIVNLPTYNDT